MLVPGFVARGDSIADCGGKCPVPILDRLRVRDELICNDVVQLEERRRSFGIVAHVDLTRVHRVVADHANRVHRLLHPNWHATLDQRADIREEFLAWQPELNAQPLDGETISAAAPRGESLTMFAASL